MTQFCTVKFMVHRGNPPKLWEIFVYSSLKIWPYTCSKMHIRDTHTQSFPPPPPRNINGSGTWEAR